MAVYGIFTTLGIDCIYCIYFYLYSVVYFYLYVVVYFYLYIVVYFYLYIVVVGDLCYVSRFVYSKSLLFFSVGLGVYMCIYLKV